MQLCLGQNRRCGTVSGLTPLTLRAPQAATTGQARFIAICDRSDSPRFSRFCPAVLGYAEGDRVPRSRYGSTLSFLSGQFRPPCATSGCRATQQSAETSECRSEATHERGGVRVAQGSPGIAGTRLSEQMLLVTFGKTKVTKKNSRGPLIIVIPVCGLLHFCKAFLRKQMGTCVCAGSILGSDPWPRMCTCTFRPHRAGDLDGSWE